MVSATRSVPLYYGQRGEDYLLGHFFDYRPAGFFIDIGAHDGVSLSNTRSFEENGWSGIWSSPSREAFAACRRIRPRVVQAACVAGGESTVELRVDSSGLYAGIEVDESSAQRGYGGAARWPPRRPSALSAEAEVVDAEAFEAVLRAALDGPDPRWLEN
jgi:hypothetical protein